MYYPVWLIERTVDSQVCFITQAVFGFKTIIKKIYDTETGHTNCS